MNTKTILLPAAAGLVLLAVYGIWHYNPLKRLAPSEKQPHPTRVTAFGSGNQPVIVKKKIPPRPETSVLQSDIAPPLIALKDGMAKNTGQTVAQNETVEADATQKDSSLALQPDGRMPSEKSASESAPPEAADKKIEPPAESVSVEPKSHLPYSILLSSCRLPQSARKIVADHQKAGLSPYVVKVEFENGDRWLRVLAGYYPTQTEALRVKKSRRLSDALVWKTPYANLIGSFSSEDEAGASLKRLEDAGYSPYLLKRAEKKFQVVVGAFMTRQGAEKQKSELQSKGIPSQIIER